MEYLKYIDIYSQPISFNIENDNKFKENFGGFLGLVLGCIFLSLFIVFGLDCFQRINPSIITQKLSLQEPQKFTLNKKNFSLKFLFLSFGIEGVATQIPTSYFEVNYYILDSLGLYANSTNFIKGTNDDYNYYMNIVNDVVVADFFLDSNFSFINFQVNLCKNSSLCNRTILDKYLLYNTVIGVVYFNRTVIDIRNKENPVSSDLDYLAFSLHPSISKDIYLTFKNISVYNDLGFIFQSPSYTTSIDIDSILDDTSISPSGLQNLTNTTNLLNGYLSFGRKKDIYQISYQKIQSVFATVGGIVNVFNLLFSLIASIYSRFSINNYIVNSIYNYRDYKTKNQIKIASIDKKNIETSNPKITRTVPEMISNFRRKSDSYLLDNEGKLAKSIGLNIKNMICPCFLTPEEKYKNRIFDEVLIILNKKLDIAEYFKFHEKFMESLKTIFNGNTSRITVFEDLFKKKINFFYSSYLNYESERFQNNSDNFKIKSSRKGKIINDKLDLNSQMGT